MATVPIATVDDALALRGTDYVHRSCSDRNNVFDQARFELVLATVSATMDSAVAMAGWTIPRGDDCPEDIKQYCIDLAIYQVSDEEDVLSDRKKMLALEATEWLTQIRQMARTPGTDLQRAEKLSARTILPDERGGDWGRKLKALF